jgi:hypothetical protein
LSDLGRACEVWAEEPEGIGRDRWLRRGLAAVWMVFFAMGGLAVASTWNRFVQGLVQAPVPASAVPAGVGEMSAGDRAAAEARRLLDSGRPQDALAELASIKPAEPVYPFALHLQGEARRALERGGTKSR